MLRPHFQTETSGWMNMHLFTQSKNPACDQQGHVKETIKQQINKPQMIVFYNVNCTELKLHTRLFLLLSFVLIKPIISYISNVASFDIGKNVLVTISGVFVCMH